ncbi:MAG: hypothetical protein CVV49_09875 [Spirochaetae bacterium HGW-Spirochaetae-5]|nr:MAG: hypothetical protein CVV49_09875 [Spirochaetae bacterium HGW-Spirochaetae-5]
MKNTKIFLLLLFILMAFFKSLNADEVEKVERLNFTLLKIPGAEASDSIRSDISKIIRKQLENEDFFIVNVDEQKNLYDKVNPDECIKKECVGELSSLASEGIVLMFSISSEEVKIGEKHVSRYVVEDLTEIRYTIQVAAVDVFNKKYDLMFTGTFNNTAKLYNEAGLIAKKITNYYIQRKPLIKNESKDTQNSSNFYNIKGISINAAMIYPLSSFTDIADYGYGIGIVLSGTSPLIPNIMLDPGITFYNMEPSTSNIDSVYMFLPEITCGYNFILNEKITLTPIAGAGYSLMLIDGTVPDDPGSSGSNFYYNPEFKAGIEALYYLTQDYSLLFDVFYHCIAERDSMLFFSSFNFGLRMNLK